MWSIQKKETHVGTRSPGERVGSLPITEPCFGVKSGFPASPPSPLFPNHLIVARVDGVEEGELEGEAQEEGYVPQTRGFPVPKPVL